MNKKKIQVMFVMLILTLSIFSIIGTAKTSNNYKFSGENKLSEIRNEEYDLDPLCNVEVTFELKKIRSLERTDHQINSIKKIDLFSDPDFYVKVFINDVEFVSDVWRNTKYVYDPQWSATLDVPEDQEFVNIKIQLWDWNVGADKLCDISSFFDDKPIINYDVEVNYSIASGHWFGDDFVNIGSWQFDPSGYGRLNGCDDGSYYENERDCELWFDIYQTDPDGDNIPYWTEVNVFETDPEVNNTGEDFDDDGCPIEWEHKWGHQMWYDHQSGDTYHWWAYNPSEYDDHSNFDDDRDGLDNVEEYMTSQWYSDPYRKDLFVEIDQMEEGPDGLMVQLLDGSKERLTTAYDSRNIVYHLDNGDMGGGELIPFTDKELTRDDLSEYYLNYFLHGKSDNWRRGVFHYVLHVYDAGWAGYVFHNENNNYIDSCQVSSKYLEEFTLKNPIYNLLRRKTFNIQEQREMVYAGVIMHEVGHTLGIFNGNTPGCDDQNTYYPWQANYWKYGPYKSVMNYRYTYSGLLDYSDGSRGKNDFDDWDLIDLTRFDT